MKQLSYAQNKVDYIVYHNPSQVQELIENFGYEAPEDAHDLVETTKLLIQKKGKTIITALLALHPDAKAILKMNASKEDNFCGSCSSFTYLPEDNYCGGCGHVNYTGQDSLLERLQEMDTQSIQKYYKEVVSKANKNPKNTQLAEKVQTIWEVIKERVASPKENKDDTVAPENSFLKHMVRTDIAVAGVIFITGFLIGCTVKLRTSNG